MKVVEVGIVGLNMVFMLSRCWFRLWCLVISVWYLVVCGLGIG